MDRESYSQGFADGVAFAREQMGIGFKEASMPALQATGKARFNKKRKQSGKQKLLTQMTKKKWDKYKKTSGKKTYVQIRAMVSRSQEYKRKAKKL